MIGGSGLMSIGVILRAVDEVTAPLKNIGGSIANFQNKMTQSSAKLKNALAEGANAALVAGAADKVSQGLTEPLKNVISTGADYEVAMSKLAAATGKTVPELDKFSRTAQDLAIAEGFKPQQVVEGMTELAKAGLNAEQTLKSITPVLHLTAAGDIALGEAATIASDTMSQFNLKAEDMGRISNVLVAAADASTIGVRDLAETMKYAAPAMSTVNQSLEETAALTALLGNQGLKGSNAGTSIKAMVNRLSGGAGQDDLAALGIQTRMSQGNIDQLKAQGIDTSKMKVGDLRKIPDILADMAGKMKNMGSAQKIDVLKKIFGDEGYGGAVKLMDLGSEAILEMTKAMAQDGIAKKKADQMTANLRGETAKLSASFDVLSTGLFTAVAPALTWLVQKLTAGVAWIGKFLRDNQWLSTVIMVVVGALAAFAAAIGPILAIGATLKAAMALWSVGMAGLTGALGVVKAAFLGVGQALFKVGMMMLANPILLIITAVALGALLIYKYWDQIAQFFVDLWNSITGAFKRAWDYINSFWDGMSDTMKMVVGYIGVIMAPFIMIPFLIIKYWDPIKAFFKNLWDGITAAFSNAMAWIVSIPDKILGAWQKVKDFFGGMLDTLGTLVGIKPTVPQVAGGAGANAVGGQPLAPGGQSLPTGAAVNQSITRSMTTEKQEVLVKFENAPKGTRMDSSNSRGNVQMEMGYTSLGF